MAAQLLGRDAHEVERVFHAGFDQRGDLVQHVAELAHRGDLGNGHEPLDRLRDLLGDVLHGRVVRDLQAEVIGQASAKRPTSWERTTCTSRS